MEMATKTNLNGFQTAKLLIWAMEVHSHPRTVFELASCRVVVQTAQKETRIIVIPLFPSREGSLPKPIEFTVRILEQTPFADPCLVEGGLLLGAFVPRGILDILARNIRLAARETVH
jgi:hypothetical protein